MVSPTADIGQTGWNPLEKGWEPRPLLFTQPDPWAPLGAEHVSLRTLTHGGLIRLLSGRGYGGRRGLPPPDPGSDRKSVV